jgi:serine/threonine protein kinase
VSAESELVTLRELLEQRPKPSLSARISLCAVLAQGIHSFHTVNWLYRGLRNSNIIFFPSSSEHSDLGLPYVSGFELSRASIIDNMTEKPKFDPSQDIYRYPDAQSNQTDGNYRKSYDMYSLGVVFIEIAFWKSIEDIVGFEDLAKARPSALRELQPWLLGRPFKPNVVLPQIPANRGPCLQQMASECSDAFHDIVECCLTADCVETPEYRGEPESSIALRLQRVMVLRGYREEIGPYSGCVAETHLTALWHHIFSFSNTLLVQLVIRCKQSHGFHQECDYRSHWPSCIYTEARAYYPSFQVPKKLPKQVRSTGSRNIASPRSRVPFHARNGPGSPYISPVHGR